jgi:signal transduction histidine kinase
MRARRADLGAHVAQVVASQRAHAERRGFGLEVRVPDDAIELPFDAAAIEQIVTNAIDNALKYAARSEPKRIEVSLARAAHEGRPGVELRVRDHGPGIEPTERERVFEQFHRVERQETQHQPGTGLGLALVRDLARAHGGHARVLAASPGAIIAVWLPLG